jgi:NAD-dependent deacetylase
MATLEIPPKLKDRLLSVNSVGVITGAGVSVESGIQPYRGAGGIYDDPEEGDRTVRAMTGSTLMSDPDLTWRTMAKIRQFDVKPNPGHEAIARMERAVPQFSLLTQNVDGLHRMAGSVKIIEIHGNARFACCMQCYQRVDVDVDGFHLITAAPKCDECGGVMRPDVVLFEEQLPARPLSEMIDGFHYQSPDLLIAAGTSGGFGYIVDSMRLGRSRGVITVEVNPEETECSQYCEFHLRGPASIWLGLLADVLEGSHA